MTEIQLGSAEKPSSIPPSNELTNLGCPYRNEIAGNNHVGNSVAVKNDKALVSINDQARTIPIVEMPPEFIAWQLEQKHRTYDAIEKGDYVGFSACHLPVVATTSSDNSMPNLTNKGVGLTPKDEYLEDFVDMLEATVEKIAPGPNGDLSSTRSLRIAAARELYAHPEHIDWRRLALLEIFEGTTLNNLRTNPYATVLWTGNAPTFMSFQINCVVEIISPNDLRFRFAWAMRRLFEYEPFHVVQTKFPLAYCFWVVDWKNKTPFSRHPGCPNHDISGEAE